MASPPCPHLLAACASQPFVDVLARYLLDNYGDRPDGLARVLLLVPTRRAVDSVRRALFEAAGRVPLLMPRIEPLGDIDLERLVPELLYAEGGEGLQKAGVIPSTKRTLILSRLVRQFQGRWNEGEPFSHDQSVRMAQALGDLIDDLEREGVAFDTLRRIVPDDYAAHWQETIAFLEIVGQAWPEMQRELGGTDATIRRNAMLGALAEYWQTHPPSHPVVIAGTTGSIPATAGLIQVVAGLSEGRVLLPGLDQGCSDEEWEAIRQSVSHPQYGLAKLLDSLGCERASVRPVSAPDVRGATPERMRLLAEAMTPAALSGRWLGLEMDTDEALRDFTLVEFANDDDEASAIALMLRDALETPDETAMLVTHDRDLAQRVCVRLRRYAIECEDGGGMPLSQTRAASLLFAVLVLLRDEAAPVSLLSLLKHPLCGLGMERDVRLRAVASLERRLLRGVRTAGHLSGLLVLAKRDEALLPEALLLLEALADALAPLVSQAHAETAPLEPLLNTLIEAAERVAQLPGEPGPNLLWTGADGRQLSLALAEIGRYAESLGPVAPSALDGILRSLLARQTYHPPTDGHPRLVILSPAEARMQHADRVVMAGLNEECWPPAAPSDPWMSRAMREKAGLPPHERTVGLSAHDFFSLAAAPRVIVTRARKTADTPRLASRWWQRLLTVGQAIGAGDLLQRDDAHRWQDWQQAMADMTPEPRRQRPEPRPPVEARPQALSVSDVERLLANPYAIYASRILELRPLEPLDKEPGPAEFGTAIHAALADFFGHGLPSLDEAAALRLERLLESELQKNLRQETLPAFWRQRLHAIVAQVLRGEAERRLFTTATETEKTLRHRFDGLMLEGRLDRIDTLDNGQVEVIDYKTGQAPGPGDVSSGARPQMPLQGALLEAAGHSVAALLYWSFSRSEPGLRPAGKEGDASVLIAKARTGLAQLIAYYADAANAYPSLADQVPEGDFSALERFAEWQ